MKYVGENALKKWTSLVKSDIKKKLDKNQGTANSGKILGVDATGEVAPTDTEVATLVDVPNGIVKGDGSTLSAAVAGTDYMTPVTGGTAGQVLTKTTDGQEWVDVPEETVIVKFTGLKDTDSGTLTCDKTYSEIQQLIGSTKQILAKAERAFDEGTGLPGADYILGLSLSGSMDGICFIGGSNYKRLVVYSAGSETWNYVFTRIASIPKTSAILKGNGSGGVSAATAGTDYMAAPTGGTAGQVLTKTANSSEWADAPKSLPDGGTAGDALVKSTDGGSWETPVEASLVDLPEDNIFVVQFEDSSDNTKLVCNKTFGEIMEAYNNGKIVIGLGTVTGTAAILCIRGSAENFNPNSYTYYAFVFQNPNLIYNLDVVYLFKDGPSAVTNTSTTEWNHYAWLQMSSTDVYESGANTNLFSGSIFIVYE